MSHSKKGDRVPPPPAVPPGADEYDIRFACRDAGVGWRELSNKDPGNTFKAWETMRKDPAPVSPTGRHHRLKGELASGTRCGESLPQWQIEVSGAGRVWYLFDEKERTCWVVLAKTGHPRQTD